MVNGNRPIDLVTDNGTDIDVSVIAGSASRVVFGTRNHKSTINVSCADQPRFSERMGGFSGAGAPRGELGVVGSLYTRLDGGTGSYLYGKTGATDLDRRPLIPEVSTTATLVGATAIRRRPTVGSRGHRHRA